jgi:hypothetical protein
MHPLPSISRCAAPVSRAGLAMCLLSASAQAQDSARSTAPRVRPGRVVGVYDEATGAPIQGAEVRDLATGLSALTTATGTVSLFFVDTSGAFITIRKLGYAPITLPVSNSVRDTIPVTITLSVTGQMLPAVTTTAHKTFTPRGPADTVRRLELTGFYDRRLTTGAPSYAFITGEFLEKKNINLLADLKAYTGRAICAANLYIDGVHIANITAATGMPPGRKPRNLQKGLADQLLQPGDIVGIENYRTAEIPAEYNMTQTTAAGCATLIWTKE